MHQHGGHSHDHSHGPDPRTAGPGHRRRLGWALGLAASYMGAEIVGGFWTGSLALLADAGHMLSDVAALTLALFASWVAGRPPDERWTFGRSRAEILAALAQGVALVAVSLVIALEAIERLGAPTAVMGPGMLAIAAGGLVVNIAGLLVLNAGRKDNLNMRGAWMHVASDALGSVGAMTAGALIWAFGWTWADPAASLAICALVLLSAWHILRESVDILMEAAPRGLDVEGLRRSLGALPRVSAVHDLHVWTIGSGEVCLSCHLVLEQGGDSATLLAEAYEMLGSEFEIDHATLQIEPPTLAGETPRSVCAGGCEPNAAGALP